MTRSLSLALAVGAFAAAANAQGRAPDWRARAQAQVRADSLDAALRALTSEVRLAGTPAQARTAAWVVARFRAWGVAADSDVYEVWLPHAQRAALAWQGTLLDLEEPPLPDDPGTALPAYPAAAGYAAPGRVRAPVVYANYGLPEDYRRLDSLGIDVRGRIVLVRYGRSFRGIKAREAERRGAAAVLLYSDPQQDGAARGPVVPAGPWRPPQSLQRGSVYNGAGDPTTPFRPSRPGTVRAPLDATDIPRLPVLVLPARAARTLLAGLGGPEAPPDWRGALDVPYRLGPSADSAEVRVEDDRTTRPYKRIVNTLARFPGQRAPHEWVLLGAHRDAWGPGAADNATGSAVVLEIGRVLAQLWRQGWRPARTIVLATWDAEEWGLIGSTEFVEGDSAALFPHAVAYLNLDVVATGGTFGAGGDPVLRSLLRAAAARVPAPEGEGSLLALWQRQTGRTDPPMEDPGGGSDFEPFYNHLGIPHLDWGFGGPYGVYHSRYDTYRWVRRFGDPELRRHVAAARLGLELLLTLADTAVWPYDFEALARAVAEEVAGLARSRPDLDLGPLRAAIDSLAAAGADLRAVTARGARSPTLLARANAAVRDAQRQFVRPEGLPGAPWTRSLLYAADPDNGYATLALPGVRLALRRGDRTAAQRELDDLGSRLRAAAAAVRRASALLRSPSSPRTPRRSSRP